MGAAADFVTAGEEWDPPAGAKMHQRV